MIVFAKKVEPAPAPVETKDDRIESARKLAAERSKTSDTDGTRRRARQKAEDDRLI